MKSIELRVPVSFYDSSPTSDEKLLFPIYNNDDNYPNANEGSQTKEPFLSELIGFQIPTDSPDTQGLGLPTII